MHILVFGGNGFIGGTTVSHLLNRDPDPTITVVNRGRSWDWDTPTAIRPRVRCVIWDRKRPLAECVELVDLLSDMPADVVLDFSGFYGYQVRDAVRLVTPRREGGDAPSVYVYISSDSVYEVCVPSGPRSDEGHQSPTAGVRPDECSQGMRPSRESDAVRPTCSSERARLKEADSYGHHKLRGEEELRSQSRVPFLVLRLADVIGPRDSTDRWWQLQLTVQLAASLHLPVYLPARYRRTPLSLVYSADVARLIGEIVESTSTLSTSGLLDAAYNLACVETVTLADLVELIRREMALPTLDVRYSDSDGITACYPSVERGPVCTEKAQRALRWRPTSLAVACGTTAAFYARMSRDDDFRNERTYFLTGAYKDLKPIYGRKIKHKLSELLNL